MYYIFMAQDFDGWRASRYGSGMVSGFLVSLFAVGIGRRA